MRTSHAHFDQLQMHINLLIAIIALEVATLWLTSSYLGIVIEPRWSTNQSPVSVVHVTIGQLRIDTSFSMDGPIEEEWDWRVTWLESGNSPMQSNYLQQLIAIVSVGSSIQFTVASKYLRIILSICNLGKLRLILKRTFFSQRILGPDDTMPRKGFNILSGCEFRID